MSHGLFIVLPMSAAFVEIHNIGLSHKQLRLVTRNGVKFVNMYYKQHWGKELVK